MSSAHSSLYHLQQIFEKWILTNLHQISFPWISASWPSWQPSPYQTTHQTRCSLSHLALLVCYYELLLDFLYEVGLGLVLVSWYSLHRNSCCQMTQQSRTSCWLTCVICGWRYDLYEETGGTIIVSFYSIDIYGENWNCWCKNMSG